MKNNKSLGNEELTEEFCVFFFNEIPPNLGDMLNRSLEVGKMSNINCQTSNVENR